MFGLRKSPLTLRGGGNLTDVAHISYTPVHEMWKGIHINTHIHLFYCIYFCVISKLSDLQRKSCCVLYLSLDF